MRGTFVKFLGFATAMALTSCSFIAPDSESLGGLLVTTASGTLGSGNDKKEAATTNASAASANAASTDQPEGARPARAIEEVQCVIRDVPKPVIARVQGYAIGGGNVLATLCDLSIASDTAQFGQVGPKVGSVDPGFGTAFLAQVIGEKRARSESLVVRRK